MLDVDVGDPRSSSKTVMVTAPPWDWVDEDRVSHGAMSHRNAQAAGEMGDGR